MGVCQFVLIGAGMAIGHAARHYTLMGRLHKVKLHNVSDSAIGSQGRRMFLITWDFGSLGDAKEIRMAFFRPPKAPHRDFQPPGEIPRDTPVL
jgi:hypothetical protein